MDQLTPSPVYLPDPYRGCFRGGVRTDQTFDHDFPNAAEGKLISLDGKGGIDPRKLKSVARQGGAFRCHTSDLFEQTRP